MSTTTPYIDVDGHILEPANLWMDYIEPKFRDRTLKIAEDDKGLEYLSIDGKPSWFAQGGTLGALGAIGQDVNPFLEPGRIKMGRRVASRGLRPTRTNQGDGRGRYRQIDGLPVTGSGLGS